MKIQWSNLRRMSVAMVIGAVTLVSCDKGNDQTSLTETQVANSEAAFSNSDEATDIGNTVVNNAEASGQITGAREEGSGHLFGFQKWDDRLKCATVTVVRDATSTKEWPVGTITISFDSAACSNKGVTRKGQIIIHYSGHRYSPGAERSITFNNYVRNKHSIEGTYTIKNVSVSDTTDLKFEVILVGGKITFPDGTTITRDQDITHEWVRASNPINDKWIRLAGGTASGTGRKGHSYSMVILKDLVITRACEVNNDVEIPVSGEKKVTTDSKEYTIDYGDGTCDEVVTITVNGVSKTITVSEDGD
jgi:hypothetical protein